MSQRELYEIIGKMYIEIQATKDAELKQIATCKFYKERLMQVKNHEADLEKELYELKGRFNFLHSNLPPLSDHTGGE